MNSNFQSNYQIYKENYVIAETSNSMSSWHCYDECKNVVNKSVKGFVHKCSPRQSGYRFQSVVYK